jgi:aminoglycoside phosphotransferase (APT) family kinase protein
MDGEVPVGIAGVSDTLEDVAAALGLQLVRRFADGVFGAALVRDEQGQDLVLKAQPRPELEPTWATGAAMAARLRADGYPSPRYEAVGRTTHAVWSLQEHLPGTVPERLTAQVAAQLVGLARRHATDCGQRRPWRDDAITAARGWRAGLELDSGDAAVLEAALDGGAPAELLETTIVHGDFHHRNALVDRDEVVGVFDWDVAGPGDWRFDLVMLAFGCRLQPGACDPGALDLVIAAMRTECPDDVVALMTACQILRIASLTATHAPAKAPILVSKLTRTLANWL